MYYHLKERVAPSITRLNIPNFFSLGLPEGESVKEQTWEHRSFEIKHPAADRQYQFRSKQRARGNVDFRFV
jgi:hypothetical protein